MGIGAEDYYCGGVGHCGGAGYGGVPGKIVKKKVQKKGADWFVPLFVYCTCSYGFKPTAIEYLVCQTIGGGIRRRLGETSLHGGGIRGRIMLRPYNKLLTFNS